MKTARFLDVGPVEEVKKGIGIWNLLAPKDEAHKKSRDNWPQQITRSRDMDRHFKVFTCEKHFESEDIEIC